MSGERAITVEKLAMTGDSALMMVGNEMRLQLVATFQTGRTEDVVSKAVYEADVPGIVDVRNGKIIINGKEANEYTFKMDYYWMMGDNRHNSADSRYWGFVPEDHVVGKPLFVWLSVSDDANPESSHYRWNRLFKWVANIK